MRAFRLSRVGGARPGSTPGSSPAEIAGSEKEIRQPSVRVVYVSCHMRNDSSSYAGALVRECVGGSSLHGEFDPGSGRTLAACLTHASGATNPSLLGGKAANG